MVGGVAGTVLQEPPPCCRQWVLETWAWAMLQPGLQQPGVLGLSARSGALVGAALGLHWGSW